MYGVLRIKRYAGDWPAFPNAPCALPSALWIGA